MTLWNNGGMGSLDNACKTMGIKSPKQGFDGSKVYDAFKKGEDYLIKDYCLNDVEATAEILRRII